MIYNVIGLMSGSSLDGLDICYAQFEEVRGKWSARILHAECMPYTDEWKRNLHGAALQNVPYFLRLHTAYGRYLGETVQSFIDRNELAHKVHFIASHGHTIWHEPQAHTTFQLGEGAAIAAVLGLPVISDLRAMDVALGGQGAPIVPIGDSLLFADYDLLLNIGGIANISIHKQENKPVAFDISVANQALNYLAQKAGKAYDEEGSMAAGGKLLLAELSSLMNAEYYSEPAPKSLSNEQALGFVADFLENDNYTIEDRLHTIVHFIAQQIENAIDANLAEEECEGKKILITGGGAFNTFLIEVLKEMFSAKGIEMVIPDAQVIAYKEALVMGLIGTLRWREETNTLAEGTGASRSSIGGAYWMGA
jgi:anhydro-N-acetylmuramic acid kinase